MCDRGMKMKKDLISVLDIKDEFKELLELSEILKWLQKAGIQLDFMKGKNLGMIFEKPSTRTRTSFEVAMSQLGGYSLYMSPRDLQLGRGETIADTARVLSRYVDAIVYRAYKREMMEELAKNATIPVINALDNLEHPCQILADMLTVWEYKGRLKGLKLSFIGDGNNVANSLMLACSILGMNFTIACPKGYEPNKELYQRALEISKEMGSKVEIVRDPLEAAKGADVLYTDVWVSMGDEAEKEIRMKVFQGYQINQKVVEAAKPDVIVMHCLPAHRGLEITDDVIDGSHSVVWDEAENRLHTEKAILLWLIENEKAKRILETYRKILGGKRLD